MTTNHLRLNEFCFAIRQHASDMARLQRDSDLVALSDALANITAYAREAEWIVNDLIRPPAKGGNDAGDPATNHP